MAVGLILSDRAKDHKPLVFGLVLIELKGNLLGTIVGKAEGLGFCTRAKDRESLCGRVDIQLDGLPSVGRGQGKSTVVLSRRDGRCICCLGARSASKKRTNIRPKGRIIR